MEKGSKNRTADDKPKPSTSTSRAVAGYSSVLIEDVEGTERIEETRDMNYLDQEMEIRTFDFVQQRKMYKFRPTNVISPDEFYMEYIIDRESGEKRQWYQKMQDFYNDLWNRGMYKNRTEVFRYRSYVAYDVETEKWERVRVYLLLPERLRAKVYFCDKGIYKWVSWEILWEMHPKFVAPSATTFLCGLADVAPVPDYNDSGGQVEREGGNAEGRALAEGGDGEGIVFQRANRRWPKEAVDFFKELVTGKLFHTIADVKQIAGSLDGFPESTAYLSVTLVECGTDTQGLRPVQAEMIKKGFAIGTGPM